MGLYGDSLVWLAGERFSAILCLRGEGWGGHHPAMKPTAAKVNPYPKPERYASNGACKACVAWYPSCLFHRWEDSQQDLALSAALRSASEGFRLRDIAEVCCRFELDSDGVQTRTQKAERILGCV